MARTNFTNSLLVLRDTTIGPATREPPPGEVSNLVDPPTILAQVTACNAICAVVVVIVVILRLYTRGFIIRSMGQDDVINVAALIFWAGTTVMFQYMGWYGLGRHLWNVSLLDYSPFFLRGWTIAAMLYSATMLLIKLSILALYRRLFPIENFTIRWHIVTIFTVGYSVGGICSSMFACTPIGASWDLTIKADRCINTAAFYIANGVLNCISDLLILALPIPIIWALSLKLRQKINLSVVFAFGSFSCIVSIIRLKSIIIFLRNGNSDITYDLVGVMLWSQAELTVAMVCANVPTLRPLFDTCIGQIIPSQGGSSRGSRRTPGPNSRHPEDGGKRGHFSRYSNGGNIELGTKMPKTHQTQVSSSGVEIDSDTESTDRIIKTDASLSESANGENGIMVHTTYQVQSGVVLAHDR